MFTPPHLKLRHFKGRQPRAAVPVGALIHERLQARQARSGRRGHLEGPHQARLVRGVAVGAAAWVDMNPHEQRLRGLGMELRFTKAKHETLSA